MFKIGWSYDIIRLSLAFKQNSESLCKGLSFAIQPDELESSYYSFLFELLYRDIKDLDLANQKTSFLKAKIKDYALSSFKSCNEKSTVSTLNKDEIFALKTLSENKDLIIERLIRVIQ